MIGVDPIEMSVFIPLTAVEAALLKPLTLIQSTSKMDPLFQADTSNFTTNAAKAKRSAPEVCESLRLLHSGRWSERGQ